MNIREVAVVAVVVLGIAGVAVPTVTAAESGTPTDETTTVAAETTATTTTETNDTGNETGNGTSPFGTQLTVFMQRSAAETNDTVDSGMWEAAFEDANESKRARLAHDRTESLERRLERLRERNQTLSERYENGSLSRAAYVAQSSRLSGRISALRTSVDDVERVAGDGHLNRSRLNRLRKDATNVTAPAVAGVSHGVVAGDRGRPHDDTGANQTVTRGGEKPNPSDGDVGAGSAGRKSGGDRGNGFSNSASGNVTSETVIDSAVVETTTTI